MNSDHIPYHLLCKSHTYERLDAYNLKTLVKLENKIELRELIIHREAAEFDMILEKSGVHNSFSLYKEKRFKTLGYQAGAIIDCLPYLKNLLDETHLNNLLVCACKIYLEK